VSSILISGLQYLKPSIQGLNDQKTLSNTTVLS
jgi:hypothetical protein